MKLFLAVTPANNKFLFTSMYPYDSDEDIIAYEQCMHLEDSLTVEEIIRDKEKFIELYKVLPTLKECYGIFEIIEI